MYKSLLFIVVFSLNFNSVGKEAFMPSKAKNMPQSCTFLGGGGGPLLRKLAVVIFRQQFKTFIPNNFTLSSIFSFQNAWPIIRKAGYMYTLVLFSYYTHSFP